MTARNKIQMIIEVIEKLNASDDVLYDLRPISRGLVVNPVKINISQNESVLKVIHNEYF